MSRRTLTIVVSTVLALGAGAAPAAAREKAPPVASHGTTPAWPTVLALPNGFQPEGIAIGKAPYAYFGSRLDGDIYRVSLRTGHGRVINQGPGTPSLGMKIDRSGRLHVAGGTGGDARVIDVHTGTVLRSYTLQTGTAFINDVVLTGHAAWYTDSLNPVLFRLPLGRRGGLPDAAVRVPITGDLQYAAGFNVNGISATPDGRGLILVQSNTGKLFRSTYTGETTEIDLGGESVVNGDGLWLLGRTLYVVQNQQNVITKIRLSRDASRGRVLSRTSNPNFDVPTTIAEYGKRFYLPNARFTTTPTPTTTYTAVGVPIP